MRSGKFQKQRRRIVAVLMFLSAVFLCRPAQAQFNVTYFDAPGAVAGTTPRGVNDSGQITGYYGSRPGGPNADVITSGFLRQPDGSFLSFDVPGAFETAPFGINNHGQIFGTYSFKTIGRAGFETNGFLREPDGSYQLFDVDSQFQGINDSGQTVGYFSDLDGYVTGTTGIPGGARTPFRYPGAETTVPNGINNAGRIVGFLTFDGGSTVNSFVREPNGTIRKVSGDNFSRPDFILSNINDSGYVVGQGNSGTFLSHLSPDGSLGAALTLRTGSNTFYDLNNSRLIVGAALDQQTFLNRGIIVTVAAPEPGTFPVCALFGLGLVLTRNVRPRQSH